MIYILSGRDCKQFPHIMEQVHALRYKVFIEELKWSDLDDGSGKEVDQFDTINAVHQIAMRGDRVVGYQRMLPTEEPHLLTHVFPELCKIDFPRGPDVYELTRYCVAPGFRQERGEVGSVGSELMAGFVEWGLAQGINKVIIEFETIWILRALKLKFFVQPLGLETQIGSQKVVATLVQFDADTLENIRNYRGVSEPVVEFIGSLAANHGGRRHVS